MDFYVGSVVKNPPVKQETQGQSLGWEDPLEKEWQSTPVFLPGESHRQRNLEGYSSWGHKESWEHNFLLSSNLFEIRTTVPSQVPLWCPAHGKVRGSLSLHRLA